MAYLKNGTTNFNTIFNDLKGMAWVNCAYFFSKGNATHSVQPYTVGDYRNSILNKDFRKCRGIFAKIGTQEICIKHRQNLY
ncbi:MAG: hypothetical protein ABI315_12200 [Bacteroidia bacterium]